MKTLQERRGNIQNAWKIKRKDTENRAESKSARVASSKSNLEGTKSLLMIYSHCPMYSQRHREAHPALSNRRTTKPLHHHSRLRKMSQLRKNRSYCQQLRAQSVQSTESPRPQVLSTLDTLEVRLPRHKVVKRSKRNLRRSTPR